MRKMMFSTPFGLERAVLIDLKTMTRRVIKDNFGTLCIGMLSDKKLNDKIREILIEHSPYKKGEIVAIAQSYENALGYDPLLGECHSAGWQNKMFTKAELLPHHIEITNIRVEYLQDISNEDCLREGVLSEEVVVTPKMEIETRYYCEGIYEPRCHKTPREAFARLINKVSGKNTWESNPLVYVYEFKRIN